MGAEVDGKEALKRLIRRLHGGADPEEVKEGFRGQLGGVSPAELTRIEEEPKRWMRRWLRWVNEHPELFPEWKSVRYFVKTVAGEESERHLVIWEYDSLTDHEAYKRRRALRGVQEKRSVPSGRL